MRRVPAVVVDQPAESSGPVTDHRRGEEFGDHAGRDATRHQGGLAHQRRSRRAGKPQPRLPTALLARTQSDRATMAPSQRQSSLALRFLDHWRDRRHLL